MPTHAQRQILPYTQAQLFDLVAGVERYPEFLPWCLKSRIRTRDEALLVADLVIGFKVFRERFTSRVTLNGPDHIHVTYQEGPFKYLNNHWKFVPMEIEGKEACEIDFYVDFEFKSRLLQSAISLVFNEAVTKMVGAFESRACDLYGNGDCAKSVPLSVNTKVGTVR